MVSYHLTATKRHWYPEKVQVRWACEAFCSLHPSLQFARGKILLKILNNQTVIERNQKKKKNVKLGWFLECVWPCTFIAWMKELSLRGDGTFQCGAGWLKTGIWPSDFCLRIFFHYTMLPTSIF